MNWPEVFLYMKAGTALDEAHRQQVEAALQKYPFFALGRMMAAKLATKLGDPRAPQLRFLASLYAPARQHYAFFLEERLRPRVPPPPRTGQASSREGTTPPASPSKPQEESASSDDSGPEPMPISPAFWPPLHGWIAARIALYQKLPTRLWQQLSFPSLELPRTLAQPDEGEPPLSTEEKDHAPSSLEPSPIEPSPPTPPPQPSPEAARPPESYPQLGPTSQSPPSELWLPLPSPFTEELPEKLITALEKSFSTEREADFSSSLPLSSSLFIQFELSSASSPKSSSSSPDAATPGELYPSGSALVEGAPSPQEETPAQLETASSETLVETTYEGVSHFHRPFIPLPGEGQSIHLPSESEAPLPHEKSSPAHRIVTEGEGMSHFHRPFIPLEETERSIHLSPDTASLPPTPAQTGPQLLSDSPLRPFIPLDIDITASIHLPVPEPEEEPASPSFALPPSAVKETESESPSEKASSPSLLSSPTWQSFLKELERQAATPLPPTATPHAHELEQLRKAFIRRLLAQRPQAALTTDKPTQPNVIDLLIEKLQSFPKTPPESGPPELSAPAWEPPPTQPLIYTETMARVYWSQGDAARAIQIYEALCTKHPEKAAYYQEQIARIRAGETP